MLEIQVGLHGIMGMVIMMRQVNADSDESDEALIDDGADLDDVEHRLEAGGARLMEDLQRVAPVACPVRHRVLCVWPHFVHTHVDLIVDEKLPDVLHIIRPERPVLRPLPFHVHLCMDMSSAAGIIARKDSAEASDAMVIGRPSTAKPLLVEQGARVSGQQARPCAPDLRLLILKTLRGCGMSSIESCRIRMPYVYQRSAHRLTCLHVYHSNV